VDEGGTTHDAAITALLPQVTTQIQNYCDRVFAQATVTEYPTPRAWVVRTFQIDRPPIASVSSCWVSLDIPRVYDATTLLVEGTDFIVSDDRRTVELALQRIPYRLLSGLIKITYLGGYATIPDDIVRAAQELLIVKLYKATGKVYHLLGESREDGTMGGIRFDDMTPNALSILDDYRLRMFL
jgi:hypothetical protein